MAALNFPAAPTNGQIYTSGSRSWIYNTALGAWEGGAAASSGGGAAQNALTPPSATLAPSVDAVVGGLALKLNISSKATSADIAAGTDDTKYLTSLAAAAGTTDLAVYLLDLPAAVVTDIRLAANWDLNNRYQGPLVPLGLTLKVHFFYPTDPNTPAYKYEFIPNRMVVRYKLTN